MLTNFNKKTFNELFIIKKELGKGSYGTVFKVEKNTKQLLALKCTEEGLFGISSSTLREIHSTKKLDHINILKY